MALLFRPRIRFRGSAGPYDGVVGKGIRRVSGDAHVPTDVDSAKRRGKAKYNRHADPAELWE
jgi:hypothetical protein